MIEKYIAAIYYVLTILLTIGYGNIAPHTQLEYMFCILYMFFVLAFFGIKTYFYYFKVI